MRVWADAWTEVWAECLKADVVMVLRLRRQPEQDCLTPYIAMVVDAGAKLNNSWRQVVNREEKAELLSLVNGLVADAESVVVSHYRGMTVAEISELRNKARELGAELRVTKNRITRLALKGTHFEELSDLFVGPTIMAYAKDPISACKLCVEFAKANEKFVVVGGGLSSGKLSMADIERLATIPSMDELRAKIIGLLQAPGAALARVTKAYSEKEAA